MEKWNDLQEECVYAETTAELTCSRCLKNDVVGGYDEEECFDQFKKLGWKSVNDYCYCPKCVKELKKLCK